MRNASSEFKQILRDDSQPVVNYIDITLSDGTVLNIAPDRIIADSLSITEASVSGNSFEIGSFVGKILKFSIANYDDFYSIYDFYMATMVVYDALTLQNGTVEKVRHGNYTITTPETPGTTIVIQAVDGVYKFDKEYDADTIFPATLQTILTDCCLDCGTEIGFTQFNNYNVQITNKPTECTYRQVVQWVSQIAGYNARMSDLDALELVWYEFESTEDSLNGGQFDAHTPYATGDNADGGNFIDYSSGDSYDGGLFDTTYRALTKSTDVKVATDDVVITGVIIKNDDISCTAGTSSYSIKIEDNQLSVGIEQQVADLIYSVIGGITIRAFSLSEKANPLYTTNDRVSVRDIRGNSYLSIINHIVYNSTGYSKLSCKADNPVKNGTKYSSEAALAIVQANRNTDKKLSTYDKSVQKMNALAMDAMGYHTSYEDQDDGSRITYMHDKPLLVDSMIIYKMTADGFFLSQDGGESYTAGFDAQGNAVLNILSAIGIVCDWIKGGTLTLGGDNNVNGSMSVLDADGNEVGRFNKDGLWASNGYFKGTIESTNAIITGGRINIVTSAQTYDLIDLKYGFNRTMIGPNYLKFSNGTYEAQLSTTQLYMGTSAMHSSLSYDGLYLANSSITNSGIATTGNLVVSGEATVGSIITTGKVSITGGLFVSGLISGSITVDASKNLSVQGNISANGYGESSVYNLKVRNNAEIVGALTAKSNVTINGNLSVTGNITGNIPLPSNPSFGSLTVTGATNLNGNVKIGDGAYDSVGFFGGYGSTKKTVTVISSTSAATASSNATKINEIINALKGYNLL